MHIHQLPAVRVTDEAFAPFGRVLGHDDDDAARRVVARFHRGQEPMPSIILEVNPDGVPACGWLARHHDQTQALTPIDGPIVVVLAPAGSDPRTDEGRDAATAFVADVGEGIQLDEGVWHWAASVRRGSVRVANLQGHRWPDDNEILSLEDRGVQWHPRHRWLDDAWAADLLAVGTSRLAAAFGGRRIDTAARTSGTGDPDGPRDAGAGTAERRPDGATWLVTDADGSIELDDDAVVAAVRSLGTTA